MGSIFTSTYPHNHGAMSNLLEVLPDKALTLAEILKKNGYRTMAVQTNQSMSKLLNFDQGFEEYDELAMDDQKITLTLHRAGEVVDRFFKWTDKNRRRPFFSYLHFMDCHLPFIPPEEHRTLFEKSYEGSLLADRITHEQLSRIQDAGQKISDADKEHILALYDGSIHYLDSQIGRLLDGLSERGLLDSTLIVFVSDHGEEFYEHGGFDHGHSLYNELLQVPFILRSPETAERPIRIAQLVRLIDILPTVLSILRLDTPAGLLGEDLTPLFFTEAADRKLAAYSEGISLHKGSPEKSGEDFISISRDGFKLIQRKKQEKGGIEFYDLHADPQERSPLAEDHPLIGEYQALLDRHRTLGKDLEREELDVSEDSEILKKLKSLGYLH